MSQNQHLRLQPLVRTKKLSVPVRRPSPCRLLNISAMRSFPLVVVHDPCENSAFSTGVIKLSESERLGGKRSWFEFPGPSLSGSESVGCVEFTSVRPKTGRIVRMMCPPRLCHRGICDQQATEMMDDFPAVVKPHFAAVRKPFAPTGQLDRQYHHAFPRFEQLRSTHESRSSRQSAATLTGEGPKQRPRTSGDSMLVDTAGTHGFPIGILAAAAEAAFKPMRAPPANRRKRAPALAGISG